MKKFTLLFALVFVTMAAFSQVVLFEENFDDGAADARWDTSLIAENSVDFAFDYIGAGIEAAPNGGGLAIRFESNMTTGVGSTISAYPIGQAFSGTYTFQFDMWIATDTSGSGTTEFVLWGVMDTEEVEPNSTGVQYAMTGENGSGSDFRVHEDGSLLDADAVAGAYLIDIETGLQTRNNNYDDLTIPGEYSYAYDGMMPMNQWIVVTVKVTADSVICEGNGFRWSGMTNALNYTGNISIGFADWFSSVASPAGSMFGLYDNVKVIDPNATAIEDVTNFKVAIYPNPASDMINVDVQERSDLILINSVGQIVHRSIMEKGKNTINISDVPQGMYFVRITSESGQEATHKIVIR